MKNEEKLKKEKRIRRKKRVRSKIFGTAKIPRLSVFRSNKDIFVQLINDELGETLASASGKNVTNKEKKVDIGREVGKIIAKTAKEKNIDRVVFDRGCYKYHGRIKAVAEGAKDEGLDF